MNCIGYWKSFEWASVLGFYKISNTHWFLVPSHGSVANRTLTRFGVQGPLLTAVYLCPRKVMRFGGSASNGGININLGSTPHNWQNKGATHSPLGDNCPSVSSAARGLLVARGPLVDFWELRFCKPQKSTFSCKKPSPVNLERPGGIDSSVLDYCLFAAIAAAVVEDGKLRLSNPSKRCFFMAFSVHV